MIDLVEDPFRFSVSPAALAELSERVNRFRIPAPVAGDDRALGVRRSTLAAVVDHWRHRFDWRTVETGLDALPSRSATIDGSQRLHFLHRRPGDSAEPAIVLLNGWPGTPLHWRAAIDELADAAAGATPFEVVAPTMPGFTLSGPTSRAGWTPARIAEVYAALLTALGIRRYVVAGSDFGSMVAMNLAAVDRGRVVGLHLGTAPLMRSYRHVEAGLPPRWVDEATLSDDDRTRLRHDAERFSRSAPARAVHVAIPETLGAALEDSPVGLLAWFYGSWLDERSELSDAVIERAIADTCLFWFTGTVTSSLRMYREVADAGAAVVPTGTATSNVPTGVTVATDDVAHTPRRWVERAYRIVYWREEAEGGHFPEVDAPQHFAATIRDFVAALPAA